ncbi:MAG: O-antigen ligase family protein, partial [Patescibacteria group bacterium]
EEKDWQKLFVLAIIGGIGMALYGFLAALGMEKFIGPKFGGSEFRFSGSIGNPAYVAAFSIFMMFYAAYLIASRYRQRLLSAGSLVLFGTIIFFSAIFLLAATRGAFMGLFAAILAGFAYFGFSVKKWRKWFLAAMIFTTLAVGIMIYFKDTAIVKSIPGSRIFDISLSAQTWQHRTYMWKIAVDGWKERPLLGWGPENYIYVFSEHFNVNYYNPSEGFGAWFDRAHSVYFDYLVETGILGLMSFLGIFAVFYWQFIKFQISSANWRIKSQKENNQKLSITNHQSLTTNALLFSIPVAYLVQGIVLFDVLPIYFNLFLFLSFAVYKFQIPSTK